MSNDSNYSAASKENQEASYFLEEYNWIIQEYIIEEDRNMITYDASSDGEAIPEVLNESDPQVVSEVPLSYAYDR